MSTTSEYPQLLEIDTGNVVNVTRFTANGEYLIGSGKKGIQVWRVKDGQQVSTIPMKTSTNRIATSRDGRYIAAGPSNGTFVVVCDAATEQVVESEIGFGVWDVDFSPDSTHLVLANRWDKAGIIWDIAARKKVQTLDHEAVFATKYSPQGDRIVTASFGSFRVWDSNDGRLLVDIKERVASRDCLLWHNNDLFMATRDRKVKQIDASTGATVAEWPISQYADEDSCIAVPQHGKFIACSEKKTITFLDTSGDTQPSPIEHSDTIRSIACSSDGQLLAIAAGNKITVKNISSITPSFVSLPAKDTVVVNDSSSVVFHTISEPELDIDSAVLDAWKRDQLTDAETLLSAAIATSDNSTHLVLGSRALVRTRLEDWDAALADAEQSIQIQRSLLAYVAKSVALIGKGEKDEGIRMCDIAFEHFHSEHVSLLLLVKAVVLFMAGDHADAISRVNDLITDSAHAPVDPGLYRVQAYMHFLLAYKHMENKDYERAIQLFEGARIELGNQSRQPPLFVTLISGWSFDNLTIQEYVCEALLAAGRAKEAAECVLRIEAEGIEHVWSWLFDFKYRCCSHLEGAGDSALNAKRYDEAISQYTLALSIDSTDPQGLLVKRSKAYAEQGRWEDALKDANQVIELEPSSPSGYERKYAVLLGVGRHDDAIVAFETMLSRMSESSDPRIRERSRHYVRPEQVKEVIRASIKNAIRNSPLVLIDASSGCLCNKSQQAAAFEFTPAFATLVVSMTTYIDHDLIEQVVGDFYRYATLSHTWEGEEPLYETVIKTVVYDLAAFPTHNKLQMFCKVARDEGFNWAWSDTCCINKGDQFILQEALVSMFKWYEGSALTIIFLCDVDRLAKVGALMMSLWNSRGWTLQEYHASKVVQIYTKDWTPYLGLTIYNHKESPEIISEMEKATGISAASLRALRPGLNDIREKLRLASTRRTTRVEDAAYSLLGIFSMTLPATYGEEDKALGRLLSQLLTSSGDTSILAWAGTSSSFNSCLPTSIAVFSQPLASHIPAAISDAEMATTTAALHASSLDLDLVTTLYDQLNTLPLPSFLVQRMKLPCLVFKLRTITLFWRGLEPVFRAQAGALGTVEIQTRQNIAQVDSLCLVHPWIDFLLDRHATGNIADIAPHEDVFFDVGETPPLHSPGELSDTLDVDPLDDAAESPPSPLMVPVVDAQMEFLARLRQQFGALLLAPTRRNVEEYRRIATENVITVQVQEITSATLNRLIHGVRVLDVL